MEPWYVAGENVEWCSCCGKPSFLVPQTGKHRAAAGPSNPLLLFTPRNLKQDSNGCLSTHIPRARFTAANRWTQPHAHRWTYRWTHTQCGLCIQEVSSFSHSASKAGSSTPAINTTWMDREDAMLSEVSQSQKDKYCWYQFYEDLGPSDSQRVDGGARGCGRVWGVSV